MSNETEFLYSYLIAFAIFVIWQICTSPIGQIHNAVSDGNLEKVRDFLKKGADPNLVKFNWQSPLSLATNYGYQEIAELLIKYGATVNPENQESLLCEAANQGYQEIVELLVASGANINHGLKDENKANPILEAALGRHPTIVQFLLARDAMVGLHLSAFQGDINSVRAFLEDRSYPINSKRKWLAKNVLLTPLHLAAIAGHDDIVDLLLNNGADNEGVDIDLSETSTPLLQAVSNNHPKTVELLIDRGADMNRAAALYVATCQNNVKMVDLLVRKGADVNYRISGDAPLHEAAKKGYVEVATILLSNNADATIQNSFDSKTPLHFASEKCHLEMVNILLEHGAEVNNGAISFFSPLAITPLDYAVNSGCAEVIDLLKSHGGIECGFSD
jgi:ankyrin repeat protein